MMDHKKTCRWLFILFFFIPIISFSATPIKSMVVFGDSLSDIGNTTHLLKSLRQEEDPAFIVTPLKIFVLNKMIAFANDYYVPQMVLDAGLAMVTDFFDHDLAPYIVNLIAKVKLVPLVPAKPYWHWRFSNGPVWNEYLAQMLSLSQENGYLNRAFGGSCANTYDNQLTVWNLIRHPINMIKNLIVGKLIPPSLGLTVQAYLLEYPQLDGETVYFIYSGANDYLNMMLLDGSNDASKMFPFVDQVIDSLGASMVSLAEAGARHFVVLGIPHIGDSPVFVNSAVRDLLNKVSDLHQEHLALRVEEMKQRYPTADFLYINTEQFLEEAMQDPAHYGFTNVTDACIDVKLPMFHDLAQSPFAKNFVLRYAQVVQYKDQRLGQQENNYTVCQNPENYLFWDEVHPSTRTHHYLAYEVCGSMQKHGYEVVCQKP